MLPLCLAVLGVAFAEEKPAEPAAPKPATTQPSPALTDPSKANEKAPDTFTVEFDTTVGTFTIEANRAWAPNGADRFYNLVKAGFSRTSRSSG